LPKELELINCPNPECQEKIRELIVVSNVSTKPVERYYACPRCFFKLDVISAQFLREEKMREHAEEEKKRKEEPSVKPPEKEEKGPSGCAGYLGYLASLPEDVPIPRECLACPKVLDCVMKTSDS
jgi:hypothetical protein